MTFCTRPAGIPNTYEREFIYFSLLFFGFVYFLTRNGLNNPSQLLAFAYFLFMLFCLFIDRIFSASVVTFFGQVAI